MSFDDFDEAIAAEGYLYELGRGLVEVSGIKQKTQLGWPLSGNQRLAWYSPARRAFVIGNHAEKMLVSRDSFQITPLVSRADPHAVKTHAYDDQLPQADFDELREQGIDGFRFLTREQYGAAFANRQWGSVCPMDQALISGLNCQLPVLHPGSGAVASMQSDKRIALHSRGADLAIVGEVKARGSITAILADSSRPTLYYGTNAGDLLSVAISPEKIGPQKKVEALGRAVNSIRLSSDGATLFVGGMGFLVSFAMTDASPRLVTKLDTSCRSIHVLDSRRILLNQGMHGVRMCEWINGEFKLGATYKTESPIDRVICSTESDCALALLQSPGGMALIGV